MEAIKESYWMNVRGVRPSGGEYHFSLGPWTTKEKAQEFSDSLTDTRIGEQLLNKLGVEQIVIYRRDA
jgi:hypothetical protein